MNIGLILVDDHAVVRDGVASLLTAQPDMRVLGSFGDGASALAYATEAQPDVAIIDVAMAGMNGIETARLIHDACAETQILMLSMHASPEYVYQARRAGARGYVLKESAGSEVVGAVRALHARRPYFSRGVESAALDDFISERSAADPLGLLSTREREVLRQVVEGRTSAQIAEQLGLSPKSVDTYRSRFMHKLGVEDLPALVKFAIRHGITGLE
ncbi:MAG: response regulator transcription factor [Betaproteobacteria bacterium]|nr:response regulator transcription factor [Betaproteobacteria bacterium]